MTDRPVGKKCGGTNRQGDPCGNPAGFKTDHVGFGNCHNHAGATPSGEKHAAKEEAAWRATLAEGIDPSLKKLRSLQEAQAESVQLAATKDWLDRAGVRVGDEGAGDVRITLRGRS